VILRLPNAAARGVLLFTACLAALALAFFSIRNALAAHASGLETLVGYQRAVRLEPSNARNWYLLGRYWQYNMDDPDSQKAIGDYHTALSLDPLSSDAWLDLATAYDGENDVTHARNAFLSAKRVYPASAEVSWRYGNFLLRQGELPSAFAEIRHAVEADPKRGTEAFSRCWRVDPDVNKILYTVLPASKNIYVGVILELVAEKQLDPALTVWSRLVALHPRMSPKDVAQFTDALLQYGRIPELRQVWQQAVSMMDNPPSDPPGSLIWDGSFESGMIGDGLAWQFPASQDGVQVALDSDQSHTGRQSLQLLFTGKSNMNYNGPCHWAITNPGSTYRFSAWVRTRALTTDEGIRFTLRTVSPSGIQLAETPDVRGTEPWTSVTVTWKAPRDTPVVQVCIVRKASSEPDADIEGAAWIDDVSLIPQSPESSKP
jgi:tetratricopeptide (TPR) repeat protein